MHGRARFAAEAEGSFGHRNRQVRQAQFPFRTARKPSSGIGHRAQLKAQPHPGKLHRSPDARRAQDVVGEVRPHLSRRRSDDVAGGELGIPTRRAAAR